MPGVGIRRAAEVGSKRLCVDTSRANPWLEKSRPGRRADLIAASSTRVHRMRQPRYRLVVEERLNHAQVIFHAWFTSTVRLSLHAAEDGESLTLLSVRKARMASGAGV